MLCAGAGGVGPASPAPGVADTGLGARDQAEAGELLLRAARAAAEPFPDRKLGVSVTFDRRAARLRVRWGWPAGQGAGARGYLVSRTGQKLRAVCVAFGLDFVVLEARQSWTGGGGGGGRRS